MSKSFAGRLIDMPKRQIVSELSEAEWARVAEVRESTLRTVLVDGVPIDEFRSAAARCYAEIGRPAPVVVVAPSPLTAIMWAWAIRQPADEQLNRQLNGQLYDQLNRQLIDQLNGQLDGQLDGQLHRQLNDQLDGQLNDQLDGQIADVYRKAAHWGWYRLAWLTYRLHVASLPGIECDMPEVVEALTAYRTFCMTMTIPLDGVVIAVGPHWPIQRDRDLRLHCTTGPAWAWPDGYGVWALDGIVVPEWVVTAPDAKRIITELDNTEQRRVALTHLGWDRAVTALELEAIDTHDDPHIGTLYPLPESITGSNGRASLLVCRNASPDRDGSWRTYGLLAAPTCRTVVEAQASLADLTVDEWLALDGAS